MSCIFLSLITTFFALTLFLGCNLQKFLDDPDKQASTLQQRGARADQSAVSLLAFFHPLESNAQAMLTSTV